MLVFGSGLILGFAPSFADQQPNPEETDIAFVSAFDGSEQKFVLLKPASFESASTKTLIVALHGHGAEMILATIGSLHHD